MQNIHAKLTDIPLDEALRYLGGQAAGGVADIGPEFLSSLEASSELLQKTARPRAVWRLFPLLPDGSLRGTAFLPEGHAVRELLTPCSSVILMAVTLGAEVEALIRLWQHRDMAQAAILDAMASAAVENVCDNFCADLQEAFAPRFLTGRFSPGYGDFPLEQQRDLCGLLDVSRRIGVSLTESGLMLPQKSVTAVIGVSDSPLEHRRRSCDVCRLSATCLYRKKGSHCGNV